MDFVGIPKAIAYPSSCTIIRVYMCVCVRRALSFKSSFPYQYPLSMSPLLLCMPNCFSVCFHLAHLPHSRVDFLFLTNFITPWPIYPRGPVNCFQFLNCPIRRNITLFVHICIHIHVIKQMIKPKYLC